MNGYSQIVLSGTRENISKEDFEKAGFSKDKVEMLSLLKEKSRGGNISEKNFVIVQSLAKQILDLFELRKNIEEHVDEQMKEENAKYLCDSWDCGGSQSFGTCGKLE